MKGDFGKLLRKVIKILSQLINTSLLTKPSTITSLVDLRAKLDALDMDLVAILANRMHLSVIAAKYKLDENSVCDKDREDEILKMARENALKLGVEPDLAIEVFSSVLKFSRAAVLDEFRRIKESKKDA